MRTLRWKWSWIGGAMLVLLGSAAASGAGAAPGTTAPAAPGAARAKAAPAGAAQPAKAAKDKSIPPAPPRAEGEAPFARLILRGATVIDGTGAPAIGPVDIVI